MKNAFMANLNMLIFLQLKFHHTLWILPVELMFPSYGLKDLELWLSKEEIANGYTIVSRAGKSLQEVHVTTTMSRNDMKTLLADVLRRTM